MTFFWILLACAVSGLIGWRLRGGSAARMWGESLEEARGDAEWWKNLAAERGVSLQAAREENKKLRGTVLAEAEEKTALNRALDQERAR